MSGVSWSEYAAERSEPRFTDWLRTRTAPDWTAAVEHPFTERLVAGTLSDEAMARYLVQDYAFVGTLVGTFGHAVGDAPTMDAKTELVGFLDTITGDEDDYFQRSFDALDVPDSEREQPETTETTRAFVDLLERAACEGGYEETLAVLVPAEWIYLEWAERAAEQQRPERFYLGEWIELHANPGFEAFVGWLREQLDEHGSAISPRRRERVARLFERTVELEIAFFDAALDG